MYESLRFRLSRCERRANVEKHIDVCRAVLHCIESAADAEPSGPCVAVDMAEAVAKARELGVPAVGLIFDDI